ncbi:hypothetical protein HDU96_010152 [Phlyctochytrium bullatum]|nr:hypothetical protein HDU96_010152 [Phlyctochytrium bullatum]
MPALNVNDPHVDLPALVVHDGITCDICSSTPLRGPRFKCLHCPDFDMCAACHNAHATRILRTMEARAGGAPFDGDAAPLHDHDHLFACIVAPLGMLDLKPLDPALVNMQAAQAHLPTPPAPETAIPSIQVAARTGLGVTLMETMMQLVDSKTLSPPPDTANVLVSPLSLWLVLSLAASGTRPDTVVRQGLHRQLGIDDVSPHSVVPAAATAAESLLGSLVALQQGLDANAGSIHLPSLVVFRNAAPDAFAPTYPPHPFPHTARTHFNAELMAFPHGPQHDAELVSSVNNWCSTATRGLIPRILEPLGPSDGTTKLLLLNAVHLKAKWENQFPKYRTDANASFYPNGYDAPPAPTPCRMMRRTGDYVLVEDECVEAVRMPYATGDEGPRLAAYILLPKPGVPLTALLTAGHPAAPLHALLSALAAQPPTTNIDLHLPSFTTATPDAAADLTPALLTAFPSTLGPAFRPDPAAGPFGPMLPARDESDARMLCVGQVVQRCMARVDEEGTEVAAVTMVRMAFGCGPPGRGQEPRVVRCDRPFVFVVGMERDGEVDVVMMVAVRQV